MPGILNQRLMLRTRLILGLLCLLLILLSMGLYSIDRCSHLGRQIQIILKENNQTLKAVQQLKLNCSRMTAALLASAAGKSPDSRADFSEACRLFDDALQQQEKISPAGDEKKLTSELRQIHTAYLKDAWKLLNDSASKGKVSESVAQRVGEQTTKMLGLADDILAASQKSINARNAASGEETTATIRLLIFAMTVAVVVALYTSIRLSRSVLAPIASLTESIRQVGEGDLDQELPTRSDDELGRLAATFNKMARQLRSYQSANSEKIQRLHLTMERTLASFPDPIFVLNSEGNVELRNPAADMLAVKLLFSGMRRLPGQVEKLVEESFATGHDHLPTLFKYSIALRFDNSDHYFMPRIVLLRDEANAAFGAAVILEDITRMRLVDDIKTNLVSTVSHELKTPLTSVRMALYLLLEKRLGPLTEKQEEILSVARDDSERLLKMLNDLLDLARLEEGPPQINLEPVAPRELVERSIRSVIGVASEASITIDVQIDDNLPNVQADTDRIGYVFTNLLSNAIKYSPHGSTVRFHVDSPQPDSVRFCVRDEGPGIPPDHRGRIFDKFYRIAGSRKTGAGLGLSIAREIVRAHHGEIGVDCPAEGGSGFYFTLRAAAEKEPAATASTEADSP